MERVQGARVAEADVRGLPVREEEGEAEGRVQQEAETQTETGLARPWPALGSKVNELLDFSVSPSSNSVFLH